MLDEHDALCCAQHSPLGKKRWVSQFTLHWGVATAELLYLHTACSLGILQRAFFRLVCSYAAFLSADFQAALFHFDDVSLHPALDCVVHPYFGAESMASGVRHVDLTSSLKAAQSDLEVAHQPDVTRVPCPT